MASLLFIMRGFLTVVFAHSAAAKAFQLRTFKLTVSDVLGMLAIPGEGRIADLAAALVLTVEAGLALSFAVGLSPTTTAIAAVSLLSLFGLTSIAARVRSAHIECMCFGPTGSMLGLGTLLRALGLGSVAMAYLFVARHDVSAGFSGGVRQLVPLLALVGAAALIMQWIEIAPSIGTLVRERRSASDEDRSEAMPPDVERRRPSLNESRLTS